MRLKQLKKKIKFYLAVSFIISLFIMLRVAITKGGLICGIYYEPSPCSIIPWITQTLIFTLGITVILILLITAIKTILKYIPEIKKIGKIKKKAEKKEKSKKEEEKEAKEVKIKEEKKKEGIIRI